MDHRAAARERPGTAVFARRQYSAVLGHVGYTEYGRPSVERCYRVEGLECRIEEVGVEASCTIDMDEHDGILFVNKRQSFCEGYMKVTCTSKQDPDATENHGCISVASNSQDSIKASQAGSGQVRQICQRCGVASGEAWCSSGRRYNLKKMVDISSARRDGFMIRLALGQSCG